MALMGELLLVMRGMSFTLRWLLATLSALEKWRYFADGCFCELQLCIVVVWILSLMLRRGAVPMHVVPGSAATDGCRRGGGIDCAAEIIVIVNAAFC